MAGQPLGTGDLRFCNPPDENRLFVSGKKAIEEANAAIKEKIEPGRNCIQCKQRI